METNKKHYKYAVTYLRGHKVYYDGEDWRYCDDNSIYQDKRPCFKCGKMATKEGYDACLGKIPNIDNACCGHGIWKAYISWKTKLGWKVKVILNVS